MYYYEVERRMISTPDFALYRNILIIREITLFLLDFIIKNKNRIRIISFSKYPKQEEALQFYDFINKIYRGKVPVFQSGYWIYSKLDKIKGKINLKCSYIRFRGSNKLMNEVRDLYNLALQGYFPEDARIYIMKKYKIKKVSVALVARVMRIARKSGVKEAYNFLINFLKYCGKETVKRINYWYGLEPSRHEYLVTFHL